jgi:hypothetical protein
MCRHSSCQAELDNSNDPSNITIYLTTYSGDSIINNLRCLTWDTTAGSVYITMTEQAPFGYVLGYNSKLGFAADIYLRESWTWMFYDASVSINLGNNQIAESARFFISGSLLPTTSSSTTTATMTSIISTFFPSTTNITTSSPSPGNNNISAGAAGAIGAAATIVVVAACLLVAYYYFYRTRQINVIHSTPEKSYTRPELDSGYNTNNRISLTGDYSNRHEVHGDVQGYGNSELPENSWN